MWHGVAGTRGDSAVATTVQVGQQQVLGQQLATEQLALGQASSTEQPHQLQAQQQAVAPGRRGRPRTCTWGRCRSQTWVGQGQACGQGCEVGQGQACGQGCGLGQGQACGLCLQGGQSLPARQLGHLGQTLAQQPLHQHPLMLQLNLPQLPSAHSNAMPMRSPVGQELAERLQHPHPLLRTHLARPNTHANALTGRPGTCQAALSTAVPWSAPPGTPAAAACGRCPAAQGAEWPAAELQVTAAACCRAACCMFE